MHDPESQQIKKALEEALWQVEEAKGLGLSITKAMNFINLSKEAQGYGNKRLAIGLINKAKDQLFSEIIENARSGLSDDKDVVTKMRLERAVREAREMMVKGNLRGAYELILKDNDKEVIDIKEDTGDQLPFLYSQALDALQKVWLKMKKEEEHGKDMTRAKVLVRDAKTSLAQGHYEAVMDLCNEVLEAIQSPHDRLREEVEDTIDDITRTLKGLFPEEPRSPKERLFKKQIEELLLLAQKNLGSGSLVEGINYSRRAREVLGKLEQETIKGDIPKTIIGLRATIDDLKKSDVDVSYEEYLLKQVEETFWKGEYIKARKIANKLQSITSNAKVHLRVNQITTSLNELKLKLKDRAGKEGYLEAREYLEKAKMLLEKSAFDMAQSFLEKARVVLEA
ncbi:MAG: hypothetical protein JW939_04465 [Candidatus Thermoplasmatota archaeon]|nr:hypothetical protein [Candidatus Thermoplasmatota archaeon]